MFRVCLVNFGMIREFDTLDAALAWARSTGFECAVFQGSDLIASSRP